MDEMGAAATASGAMPSGMSTTREYHVRTGRAKRAATFADVEARAAAFMGTAFTPSQAMRLVTRMGAHRYGCDGAEKRLSAGAKLLLCQLVSYLDAEKLGSGQCFVWPSNETLADQAGVSIRQVQDQLAELETAGLAIRRYDRGNGRLRLAGIDLRPFCAMLPQLAEKIEQIRAVREARRQAVRDMDTDKRDIASGDDEQCIPGYKTKGFSRTPSTPPCGYVKVGCKSERPMAVEQAPLRGSGFQEVAARRVPLENLGTDKRLIELMWHGSASFRQLLQLSVGPEFGRHDATIVDVTQVIAQLRREHFPDFNDRQWAAAIDRHGARAAVALLVALEQPGVRSRAAYLAGILRKSATDPSFDPEQGLRRLVRH